MSSQERREVSSVNASSCQSAWRPSRTTRARKPTTVMPITPHAYGETRSGRANSPTPRRNGVAAGAVGGGGATTARTTVLICHQTYHPARRPWESSRGTEGQRAGTTRLAGPAVRLWATHRDSDPLSLEPRDAEW